ncbi:hypothetical protein EVAR_68703_1 [Eumeta japonica]|uniref:Uncharacterized protein n=1 Tax=Eumeta variegata TaxID=151549 RepID=A0A4C2A4A2_EUMVA|nr:hypothetical protein EVAR_68703_1 [Eumeta japonica]
MDNLHCSSPFARDRAERHGDCRGRAGVGSVVLERHQDRIITASALEVSCFAICAATRPPECSAGPFRVTTFCAEFANFGNFLPWKIPGTPMYIVIFKAEKSLLLHLNVGA